MHCVGYARSNEVTNADPCKGIFLKGSANQDRARDVPVVAAIAVIPIRLGGYAAVFNAADAAFKMKGSGADILPSNQYVAYATLVLGSAFAASQDTDFRPPPPCG
jgi:hypothetical protein